MKKMKKKTRFAVIKSIFFTALFGWSLGFAFPR
jgi:hypothetical protein